jgi:hypothetical protein
MNIGIGTTAQYKDTAANAKRQKNGEKEAELQALHEQMLRDDRAFRAAEAEEKAKAEEARKVAQEATRRRAEEERVRQEEARRRAEMERFRQRMEIAEQERLRMEARAEAERVQQHKESERKARWEEEQQAAKAEAELEAEARRIWKEDQQRRYEEEARRKWEEEQLRWHQEEARRKLEEEQVRIQEEASRVEEARLKNLRRKRFDARKQQIRKKIQKVDDELDVAAAQDEDRILEDNKTVLQACLANDGTLLGLPATQHTPTKDERINRGCLSPDDRLGLPAKPPTRKGTPTIGSEKRMTSKQLSVDTEMFKDRRANAIAAKKKKDKEKRMLAQRVKQLEPRTTRSKLKAMSDSSSVKISDSSSIGDSMQGMSDSSSIGDVMKGYNFDSAEPLQKTGQSPGTTVVINNIDGLMHELKEETAQAPAKLGISME